ncbi:MAG TPA: POTRA domain-containing protein, partial [Acidobacteriota bacterium]|nr:POTRA domain-containing protein [Acidobacteriota bacterium]
MNKSLLILMPAILVLPAFVAAADTLTDLQFRKVSSVSIKADGAVDEPSLLSLIEVTSGVDILTTSKIRRSIELLYATGNFTNILVDAREDGDRVALTFILKLVYRFQYVHLTGDLGVSGSSIRRQLRLRKLEPYTPEKILKGRDDILAVLHENGYYDARVQQDVLLHRSAKRAEVTYWIQAGQAATIGSLSFSGSPFFPEDVLRKTIKSAKGSRFRQFQFEKDMQRIEAIYDKNGFLEHDIKVARQERDPKNRMQLEIAIQSGKQLLLKVEGFALPADALRDQLPIWADHSYNDDTLEEGKRNLIVYLQGKGYYDATVEWEKLFEKEKILITYKVHTGILYELTEIRIHGNDHFPEKEILQLMKTKKSDIFTSGHLVKNTFESDCSTILDAYRNRGFLFARFVKQDVLRMRGGKLILDLEINEDLQVLVADIRLKGNEVVPTSFFLEHFIQKIGEPVSESNVKTDSDYIVALYSDKGYPKIKLENKLLLSNDKTR